MKTTASPSPAPYVPVPGALPARLEILPPYTDRPGVYVIGARTGPHSHRVLAEVQSLGGTPEQCRGLADLMAAAPDLLAVARAAVEWANDAPAPYRDWPFVVAARAAIARATGEKGEPAP